MRIIIKQYRNLPIRILLATALIAALAMCKSPDAENSLSAPLLIDAAYLENTKRRIAENDPKIQEAFASLVKDAENALKEGPYSVTHKERIAPSGDPHDYASYSRYWWPDPNKTDGLPYICLLYTSDAADE